MLLEGDKIPLDVTIQSNGEDITLNDYLGKYLVIYFYPKDNTETCTKEACSFRDYNYDIRKLGAEVLGISSDKQKSHQNFIDKYSLNFTLLSDPNQDLQKAFGVWGEKILFGKKVIGTIRSTFLVDPSGVIIKAWSNVKVKGHVEEIYNHLKELKI